MTIQEVILKRLPKANSVEIFTCDVCVAVRDQTTTMNITTKAGYLRSVEEPQVTLLVGNTTRYFKDKADPEII